MIFDIFEHFLARNGLKNAEKRYAEDIYAQLSAEGRDVDVRFGRQWAANSGDVLAGCVAAILYSHIELDQMSELVPIETAERRRMIRGHFGFR